MRSIYPTIPNKPILFLGLLFRLFNGRMTLIFSFLLSRLLFEESLRFRPFFGRLIQLPFSTSPKSCPQIHLQHQVNVSLSSAHPESTSQHYYNDCTNQTKGRSIGGKDMIEVDVGWLREHAGVVSQQLNLFDASIADNIRYGGASTTTYNNIAISDMDIRKAAKSANVHSFIMGLPQSYETHL